MQQSHEPAALAEMAAFAAIAEARSFTRAAVRVGRDATILSRRLQSLEERLGVRLTSVGPVRARLIAKGMIYPPQHGDMAFTVPMFDSFMRRAMPELA